MGHQLIMGLGKCYSQVTINNFFLINENKYVRCSNDSLPR